MVKSKRKKKNEAWRYPMIIGLILGTLIVSTCFIGVQLTKAHIKELPDAGYIDIDDIPEEPAGGINFAPFIRSSSLLPKDLDQSQTLFDGGIGIMYQNTIAQGIENDRDTLVGFRVYIYKLDEVNDVILYIGIKTDTTADPYDTSNYELWGVLEPEDWPSDDYHWLDVDIELIPGYEEGIPISAGENFQIVFWTYNPFFLRWAVGYAGDNPYIGPYGDPPGWNDLWWWDLNHEPDPIWNWGLYAGDDVCFQTFTPGSSNPPVIVIEFTEWLIYSVLGFLSLLGGGLSSLKYYAII
jgi:hypothetical protein